MVFTPAFSQTIISPQGSLKYNRTSLQASPKGVSNNPFPKEISIGNHSNLLPKKFQIGGDFTTTPPVPGRLKYDWTSPQPSPKEVSDQKFFHPNLLPKKLRIEL